MSPTIKSGETVEINFWTTLVAGPKRWEIVAYSPPDTTNHIYLGRVVGLPGERITLTETDLFLNDVPLNQLPGKPPLDYFATNAQNTGVLTGRFSLSQTSYYVLADNSLLGMDSRHLGPIDRDSIQGRVHLKGRSSTNP